MSATAPVPAENNKLTAFTAATSALTFAIFGIAVPASTYVMIRFTEYYKMEQTAPLQFIGKTFPWLPLLLAIAIPAAPCRNFPCEAAPSLAQRSCVGSADLHAGGWWRCDVRCGDPCRFDAQFAGISDVTMFRFS